MGEIEETVDIPVNEKEIIPLQKGRIMLELIKAKDLQKKGLFGKPDPYLKIVFCDKKFVSPVMKNNANPEWKYPIEFNINENSPKEIKVEVFDEDFGKDDFLGSIDIPLSDLSGNLNTTKWAQLEEGKAGSILYSSKFIPTEMIGTILDVSDVQPVILKPEISDESQQKAEAVQDSITNRETITMQESISTNKIVINEEGINYETEVEEKVRNLFDENSQVLSIEIPTESLGEEYHTEVTPKKIVFKLIEGRNLKNTDIVGKADPYVALKYKDEIFKTKTINNNLNPKWEFQQSLIFQKMTKILLKLLY